MKCSGRAYACYSRQHPDIEIGPYDGISDNGQEIYNYCEQLGIRNIVMTGVHTNMCVLGRPFGIRQMKRWAAKSCSFATLPTPCTIRAMRLTYPMSAVRKW